MPNLGSPYLVACLATLRTEFNRLSSTRDKGSDGWIGDAAHQQEQSDHNPDPAGRVLALDIDSSGPWPAPFGDIVESLRGDPRLEYIIWNRRIASRDRGWTWRAYTGTSDPHTGHAHFSARHDHTGNTSTGVWGLEDFMELTSAQIDDIAERAAAKVWAYMLEDPESDATPRAKKSAGAYVRYADTVAITTRTAIEEAVAVLLVPLHQQLTDLQAAVAAQTK